ncbi:MAG: hypothetical protein J7L99_04430 [Planctomycetes bacterium]|nr:hypothetical protein [Planctomycetota bacterium]
MKGGDARRFDYVVAIFSVVVRGKAILNDRARCWFFLAWCQEVLRKGKSEGGKR